MVAFRYALVVVVCVVLLLAGGLAATSAHAAGVRVDLRVLVLTDGLSEVEAIAAALERTGVPTRVVDLRDPGRPVIDGAFLADDSASRDRFQGVVLPDHTAADLTEAEREALWSFERRYGIRQLNASVLAGPAVGLAEVSDAGYSGPFDGGSARITDDARTDGFGHLRGDVPFDDVTAADVDSWVEIAPALTGFRPFLTAVMPTTGRSGALAGVLARDGREQLSLTFTYGADSIQFLALAARLATVRPVPARAPRAPAGTPA